ncbi:MAG: hypothetical protein ACK5N8_00350 [Alphaproteobacteria bacterium]
METTNQRTSVSGKNAYAQVMAEEATLITNKKGKFARCIRQGKKFNLFVLRSGFYVLMAQENKVTISKVIGFSEKNDGENKETFAVCKIIQQKEGEKWSATPPKVLERAIRNLEKQNQNE